MTDHFLRKLGRVREVLSERCVASDSDFAQEGHELDQSTFLHGLGRKQTFSNVAIRVNYGLKRRITNTMSPNNTKPSSKSTRTSRA